MRLFVCTHKRETFYDIKASQGTENSKCILRGDMMICNLVGSYQLLEGAVLHSSGLNMFSNCLSTKTHI